METVILPNSTTRKNYIFVDYENVPDVDLDLIAGKSVKVFLIVGKHRKSNPTELTRQVHAYRDQVEWIVSEGASRNALDLVLAYHVGMQAKEDPDGYFHILSKDKDYDALIEHLRANEILACRDEFFDRIPVLVTFSRLSVPERVQWVVERFRRNKASRPKRKTTLLKSIHGFCRKELSDAEVEQIIAALISQKLIEITPQGGVEYRL